MLRPKFHICKNKIHLISLSSNSVPPLGYGGIELIVGELAKGLSEIGYRVLVYSPGSLNVEEAEHFQTIPKPVHRQAGTEEHSANTKDHLNRIKHGLKKNIEWGDIVLFNHPEQFRFLKRQLGFFKWLRCYKYEIAHWLDVGLYRNIIYPSASLKTIIDKPGTVINHGETLDFPPVKPPRDKDFFYAGRVTKDKGIDIAIAACEIIGCKLRIAGPATGDDFFHSCVSHPNVIYLGELAQPELQEEYFNSYALIYLTQYVEPFGLSVIEAMSQGCPVVTTGLGGTGETVIENCNGFFCKSAEDVACIYSKIGQLSRKTVQQSAKKFTYITMAKNYDELFREISYG